MGGCGIHGWARVEDIEPNRVCCPSRGSFLFALLESQELSGESVGGLSWCVGCGAQFGVVRAWSQCEHGHGVSIDTV